MDKTVVIDEMLPGFEMLPEDRRDFALRQVKGRERYRQVLKQEIAQEIYKYLTIQEISLGESDEILELVKAIIHGKPIGNLLNEVPKPWKL